MSISRPGSGQYRGNGDQAPQQVSQFSQGHRVQSNRYQQQSPSNQQFSNAPVNYNPYSTYQSSSQGQLVGQNNFISHPGRDNIPYKTGYILLQNNNPKRPVNVNVYKRPLSNPNVRRPNVIIKKPIYKNKQNGQSVRGEPTKHIMLVKPVNGQVLSQSASSLSQVVITPKGHGQADTFPTSASKKVTVTYSTSSAQANLNKIKPVLPLLVAEKPTIAHAKIQKKSEILPPNIPIKSGFNPSSVVIESGFKPIIGVEDEAQKRMSNDDVEYIDETTTANTGVEQVTNATNVLETKQTVNFEPIFIPSPPDQQKLRKEKKPTVSKPVRQVLVRKRVSPYAQDDRNQQKVGQNSGDDQVQTYFLPPSGPIYGIPKNINKKQDKFVHVKKDLLHVEENEKKKEEIPKVEDKKEVIKIEDEKPTITVADNNEIKQINSLKEDSSITVHNSSTTTPKYKNHKYEEVKKINEKLKDKESEEADVVELEESKAEKADYTLVDSVEEGRKQKKLKFTRKYSLLRPRRSPHHHPDHKGNDTEHEEHHRNRRSPHHHPDHKGNDTEHETPDHHGDASDYDEHHDHHSHHNMTVAPSMAVTTSISVMTMILLQLTVIRLR
ncbi:hypothetical protein WDU94_002653 [Cyamophila willieti]